MYVPGSTANMPPRTATAAAPLPRRPAPARLCRRATASVGDCDPVRERDSSPVVRSFLAMAGTQGAFFDPGSDAMVSRTVENADDVDVLIATVLARSSARGRPSLELTRVDGSCLSLATDGSRALLVFADAEGRSFDSVGTLGPEGPMLVFDYMASWSEAPPDTLVPLSDAIAPARQFVLTGNPQTDRVQFTEG
jgi:hypothetical protein